MPEDKMQITNNYYNCTFNTYPLVAGLDANKKKIDAVEASDKDYREIIKKISKETQQAESLVEYIIQAFIESGIE